MHVRTARVVRRDQPRDVHEQVARRGLPGERMDGHGRRPTTADAGRAPWHEALAPTFTPTVLAVGFCSQRRLWHRPRDGTRLAGPSTVGVATYRPRAAEGTVLHRVVRENLETFLREAADRSDGGGLH